MNKTILIGGSPTVGKSYFTRKMAEEFKMPWISSDDIRAAMIKLVRKEDYPRLFDFEDPKLTAESYLSSHSPEQIVAHQNTESEDVWKGVKAFIDTSNVWKEYMIEGIAILPKLVAQIDKGKYAIKPIFLIDENEERIREVVYSRGIWDDAKTYSDSVKEIEVQWAVLFNQYIKSEATKYSFDYHVIEDRDKSLVYLISEIKNWLQAQNP